ncbi:7-carboxy-7-deazaguanine synthase QueE [Desulfuribacillus alkaliarsenatis]|uniref:7-carboxy-7-deazaguanine synthase n=1 Tax=Desulfuribacillus alkaliarsenatis TaxID=766136 RepID=A0A1E5G5R4_9FIRM|nr:7-carboxy-7-deazaguanine synthase QueE [Desulfuribacillus alkaliarsenatis]OEF98517.1 hypothetical protein BHF68_02310 [Desulfuribacillus alkaliarsenatis]
MSHIVEVFSGIQGEGPIVGYRQIFVRFSNCQLACNYCDTNFTEKDHAMVEITPGHRDWSRWHNPISADKLVQHILSMYQHLRHHSVSLTGGEPLLHASYLKDLTNQLIEHNIKSYLETNGLLHRQLKSIISNLDLIGMDIKLESATGEATKWTEHETFLEIAKQKQVFVKIVVSNKTTIEEVEQVAKLILKQGKSIPLIMQPVTPTKEVQAPAPDMLLVLMNAAIGILTDVRVIPQTHVMLNQQ